MNTARLEACIGRAHRNVWLAQQEAAHCGYTGLADDLEQLTIELARIGSDLLSDRRPRPLRLQTTLPLGRQGL